MAIKLQEEMTVSKTLTPTPIQAHFAHLLASSGSVFFFTAQRIQPTTGKKKLNTAILLFLLPGMFDYSSAKYLMVRTI